MKKPNVSLQSLDGVFERIEKVNRIQRILIYVGAFVLLIGPFVWFSFLPKYKKITELEKKLENLETQLVASRRQAAQLATWKKKYKDAQARFAQAKKALPQKKEIPSLLTAVSESGQRAGLEFLLFKPQNERRKQFYAEIPVAIRVTGSYHETADFFDKVSNLPRLVNIDNITLKSGKGNDLSINCTALTYRFIEAKTKKGPAKKGGRKK